MKPMAEVIAEVREVEARTAEYHFQFDYWGEGQVHSDGTITLRDSVNSPILFGDRDLPVLLAAVVEAMKRAGVAPVAASTVGVSPAATQADDYIFFANGP